MSNANLAVVTAASTPVAASEDVVIAIRGADELFPDLGAGFQVAACGNPGNGAELVPVEPDGYFPPERETKQLLLWLSSKWCKQGLLLKGESGTGKTELVLYVGSRLGMPVATLEVHPYMTPEVIDGQTVLVPDGAGGVVTKHLLSEVALRYKHGGIILLDEVDKVGDELQARLHAVIDGKPITIPATGEVIRKHPHCRVIGTANTVGDGSSQRYLTSRPLDEAFRNRWAVIELAYLSPSREVDMLRANYPMMPKGFIEALVRVANSARDAALGPERDGNISEPMGSLISTRVLRNLLNAVLTFGAGSPFTVSLDFAVRGMMTTADRYTFNGIVQRHLGDIDVTSKELMTRLK